MTPTVTPERPLQNDATCGADPRTILNYAVEVDHDQSAKLSIVKKEEDFAFLGHWLAAFLVAGIFFNGEWRGWTLLLSVTPIVLGASAAFAALNRKFLEPLRCRVRGWCGPYPLMVPDIAPAVTQTNR